MDKFLKYAFRTFLLAAAFIQSLSCAGDKELAEVGGAGREGFGEDVYSLNFTITLDNLGAAGTRAFSDSDPEKIRKYENYINIERLRVMFFDTNDMFLFESKNRWVKKIDSNGEFSSWFVSVPFGPFGDDGYGEGMEYDWTAIREHLTTHEFKIAILANRPAQLLYPGFTESTLELPDGVFDNDGPYWGPEDSGKKSIFELQHFQYDIIYADKGNHSGGAAASYYDFVMGNIHTDRPTMGSAINWVSFDNNDTDKVALNSSTSMRHLKMPSEEHPIPMYGIQIFDRIPASLWKEGTPFDLSNLPAAAFPDVDYNYKTISLLRSCVRLDLVIPKTIKGGAKPSHVSLWYANIYSRTEPMDVWTPTNLIWGENHEAQCELEDLIDYGPVSSTVYSGRNTESKAAYQQCLSWFYGAWKDKGWQFETLSGSKITPPAVGGSIPPYPRIFNPCIQRNKVITCERGYTDYGDNYHHYVVYTGERNINDPNTLPNMAKNPYIACFVISWDNSKYYCVPLLNYRDNTDSDFSGVFGPHTETVAANGSWPSAMNTYMNSLQSEKGANLPYPLLRNHIYRFTLTGTKADGDEGIGITSEVFRTPDIDFSGKL